MRAVVIIFSFAMLIGAGTYTFYYSILPGLNRNTQNAELIIPLTGCQVQENKSFEAELLQLINVNRQNQGLADLSLDSRLYQAAERHSWDMGCYHYFNHAGLDGQSMYDRLKTEGYIYSDASEVIYAGGISLDIPREALKAWLANDDYKTRLLSPAFSQVGIGAVTSRGGPYSAYYTVVFASPAH